MSTALDGPTTIGSGADPAGPGGPVRRTGRRAGQAAPCPPGAGTPRRRSRLAPDPLLLAASIAAVAFLVKLAWPRFTWFGDNAESFFPLWHMVGTSLRAGHWPGFDPTGWTGGNVVGEAAYGIFNPVTLANAVLVSGFDELARASFLVMTEFLVLLGLAVRLLALSYGAHRSAAFTAGIIVPFGGFTLYWGAGNWASSLMALTWMAWTWWAARRYVSGAGGPLPVVLFAALAVTVGSPNSLLGVLVVLVGLAVEVLLRRDGRRLGGLVFVGLCIGGFALLTFLPLLDSIPVSDRSDLASVSNHSYLAPSLGDLVGASSPTLVPEINAWGRRSDVVPSVYLSWLVLPLLPWLRWRAAGQWRSRLGLLVPTALFTLMTLGPDNIWLFRWPLRMIDNAWAGLTVCLALLLSAGLARDHLRRRAWATVAVVAGGFFLAWSSTPAEWVAHLGWAVGAGALVAGTLVAVRRRGPRALPVMAVVGTMLVTPGQAATFGWEYRNVTKALDLGRASDLNAVRGAGEAYRGTVLQLADVKRLDDPEATTSGHLTFGHMLAAAGHDTLNRYTGIGFSLFMSNMSLDYRGSLRNDWSVPVLYVDVPGGRYDTPLVDALGIDTLVLSRRDHEPEDHLPRAGWRTVLQDEHRTVLQRLSIPAPGPTATPSPGVTVLSAQDAGDGVRLTVESADGGTVLVDRLAWPGYRAVTGSGAAVDVGTGPIGLLEVTVPAGTTTIDVEYEVPGLRTGLAAAAAVTILALAHHLLWWFRRRTVTGSRPPGPPPSEAG